jgi:branched-chain amino acid transport system ATP-binding protein
MELDVRLSKDNRVVVIHDWNLNRIYHLFPVLKARERQKAGMLSGGEQQMLAIGRGLMSRPRLLMFDEPSLGLAPLFVLKMFELIQQINRQGVTILLVEQNAKKAFEFALYGYIIEGGKIKYEGKAKELMDNEEVIKSYFGV